MQRPGTPFWSTTRPASTTSTEGKRSGHEANRLRGCRGGILGGKAPALVVFNGMDNCKEMNVVFAGLEFSRRGMHVVAIYTEEEGGAEHCQVDDRQLGIDYMADWIAENVNNT